MKNKNEIKAEAAPSQAVATTIQGIEYKTALLAIGRMAQARKSAIRMPNGMTLDNYVGQVLAYVPLGSGPTRTVTPFMTSAPDLLAEHDALLATLKLIARHSTTLSAKQIQEYARSVITILAQDEKEEA